MKEVDGTESRGRHQIRRNLLLCKKIGEIAVRESQPLRWLYRISEVPKVKEVENKTELLVPKSAGVTHVPVKVPGI